MKSSSHIASDRDSMRFRADCAACKGICCVVLYFDTDQGFGFDKPACQRCPNLADSFACRIHDVLEPEGFKGCADYDCYGAGQRITRALALPDDWYTSETLLAEVYRWFSVTRNLHEQMAALDGSLRQLGKASMEDARRSRGANEKEARAKP